MEEYPFSSESEKEEPEEVFDTESEGEDNMELFERSKTKPTVIEILDDDDDMTFDPSSPHYRPWRGCNADQRYQYELMFCNVIDRPKQNDLDYTEDLQRELDGVMHLYVPNVLRSPPTFLSLTTKLQVHQGLSNRTMGGGTRSSEKRTRALART